MLRLFKRNQEKVREKTEQGVRRSRETLFGHITGLLRARRLDDAIWEEMEELLISADLGVDTSLKLVEQLKTRARADHLAEPGEIIETLKRELVSSLNAGQGDDTWLEPEESTKPFVILVVGVNGAGKTTSIAKLAHNFKEAGQKVVLGAADTFRAAASDQLEVLGERVGVDVISHQAGADPGAVAYDAFQASTARGADVLIVDTAGRLHTKSNLMEELKKIRRVLNRLDSTAPHQVLLVLDATTGHNGLSQARHFTEAVDCTGIFLAKLDGTAKGGIVIAIRKELGIPILFIGTGENLQDMVPFEPGEFVEALLGPASPSQPTG